MSDTQREGQGQPGDRALVYAVLVGPVSWVLQLNLQYGATPFLCESGWEPALHVVSLAALVSAASGLAVGRRAFREIGERRDDEAHHRRRMRQMAIGGMLASAFFLVVIAVQAMPALFLEPCR